MKNIRIATTTTGSRYVVDRIDFDSDTVHCWGEVVAYRGKRGPNGVVIHSVTHQRSAAAPFVRFPRAEVILVEMVRTEQLCIELLNQAKRAHRRGASGPFAPQTAKWTFPRSTEEIPMSKLTIIEISPTVPAADQADAALVLVWMLSNAEAHETATSLAEEAVECALDREPWEWLDDDTHWIWDLAAAVFAAR